MVKSVVTISLDSINDAIEKLGMIGKIHSAAVWSYRVTVPYPKLLDSTGPP